MKDAPICCPDCGSGTSGEMSCACGWIAPADWLRGETTVISDKLLDPSGWKPPLAWVVRKNGMLTPLRIER